MLRDLTIQNYRCFKDFHIDDLARVNLIVGMNNSGKTSLLEAVYLLVNQENFSCLFDLINQRGEIAEPSFSLGSGETHHHSSGYQVKHIFYNHQLNPSQIISIQSQKEYPLFLKIQFSPYLYRVTTSETIQPRQSGFRLLYSHENNDLSRGIPIRKDGFISAELLHSWQQNQLENSLTNPDPNLFIITSNLSFEKLAVFWDQITLTPKEENVVAALQILEPNVERISFTSSQTPNSGILLKVRGQSEPIPLGSMGEGMRRILTLAMATVTVENGFLLVDEIETGLHYETQTYMWRLILETAQQLNVQVFATTHSWDCISAFQEALEQLEDSSVGKLFRLSRKGENIRPVAYTADELAIAVPHSIEVR